MSPGDALRLGRRLWARARQSGPRETARQVVVRHLGDRAGLAPLTRVERSTLFADPTRVMEAERRKLRTWSLVDASYVADRYPHTLELGGRTLRFMLLPAATRRSGLVVLFHGHYAAMHLGPVVPLRHFDVLAPWDTFGWRRQGSWFWGEQGTPFVAELVAALIERHRRPGEPWFCAGSSMGGFGALYHGLTLGCDGMYVQAPQVDLRRKVADYGAGDRDNPYGYLVGRSARDLPDLVAIAEARPTLPPLYLVQNLMDPVNPLADHGFPLLQAYSRTRAWWGARIAPAAGHAADGSLAEAECFFTALAEKRPFEIGSGGPK